MHSLARAALVAAVLIPASAFAIDRGQWGHDPATAAWFKSLHNDRGTSCCDYVDGAHIEDPDWREIEGGRFEVFARGEWQTIDPDRVIKGTNRLGFAILWWPENWPAPTCFLPGSGG
jgi:hypothetical protein